MNCQVYTSTQEEILGSNQASQNPPHRVISKTNPNRSSRERALFAAAIGVTARSLIDKNIYF